MTKPDTSFKVRMPAELKALVEEAAEREGRSINAEIVQRLSLSFSQTPNPAAILGLTQVMNILTQMLLSKRADWDALQRATYQDLLNAQMKFDEYDTSLNRASQTASAASPPRKRKPKATPNE